MAKLEFVLGRAGTGKTEYCLRAMRDAMEREPLGRLLLLVVPEHMTYQAERDLGVCRIQRSRKESDRVRAAQMDIAS